MDTRQILEVLQVRPSESRATYLARGHRAITRISEFQAALRPEAEPSALEHDLAAEVAPHVCGGLRRA